MEVCKILFRNSWMRHPRCKHEYLVRSETEETSPDADESDKLLESRDRRYSCLIIDTYLCLW